MKEKLPSTSQSQITSQHFKNEYSHSLIASCFLELFFLVFPQVPEIPTQALANWTLNG